MNKETLRVAQEFTTLDLLLWRRFSIETAGMVESTLSANQDLSELGPFLPVGTLVDIEFDVVKPTPIVRVTRLWN